MKIIIKPRSINTINDVNPNITPKINGSVLFIPKLKPEYDAKILFGPGKAANAGGVAVSGLEMSQNNMRLSWTREEVDQHLHQIMKDVHKHCRTDGTEVDYVNYIKGANIGGFIKVADAMIDQGVVWSNTTSFLFIHWF